MLQLLILLIFFALTAQRQSASLSRHPDPKLLFDQAQRALAAGDYSTARKGFDEVLRIDPKSAAAYSNLGVVDMRLHYFGCRNQGIQRCQDAGAADSRDRPESGFGLLREIRIQESHTILSARNLNRSP